MCIYIYIYIELFCVCCFVGVFVYLMSLCRFPTSASHVRQRVQPFEALPTEIYDITNAIEFTNS